MPLIYFSFLFPPPPISYNKSDNEPPRVRECPESFSSRLSQGQSAKPIMWMEPHFSDNVRISALKKSHEPGSVLSVGEHLINYEAKDSSDNKARCSFTITVFPRKNKFLDICSLCILTLRI